MARDLKKEKVEEDERGKVKKSLKYSVIDGSAHSLMEGFGKSYIVPFAMALKASTTMIGVISSLPDLIGALFQFTSASLVEKFKTRKAIIVFCALMQAILWLPMFFVPLISEKYGPLFVLLFFTLQAIMSYTINPLWNSLMGDLVPEDERGRYFGRRNAITGVCVFAATFVAGLIMNHFSSINPFIGFGILFSIAFVSRAVSALYLYRIHEPEYAVDQKAYFSFIDFTKRMAHNNYGRFTLYLCIMNFVVFLSSPFYTVYMLRDLQFSYFTFMMITLASLVASFIGMYVWGRFNDKFGSKKLLYITGFLVPFGAICWVFTKSPYWLFAIEVFSGFAWAGFNLGTSNFIFDATTPQKRTRCLVYFNVLRGVAIFAGATIGGILATHMPSFGFLSALPVLFLISGILRFTVSLIFLPLLREMRLLEVPVGHSLFRTHLTITPKQGIVYEAIGTHKKEEPKEVKKKKPPEPPIIVKDASKGKKERDSINKDLGKFIEKEKSRKK